MQMQTCNLAYINWLVFVYWYLCFSFIRVGDHDEFPG